MSPFRSVEASLMTGGSLPEGRRKCPFASVARRED